MRVPIDARLQRAADTLEENNRQRWLVRNGRRNYDGKGRASAVRKEQVGVVEGIRQRGQTRSVPSGQPMASWSEVALALVFLGVLVPVCAVLIVGHGVVLGVKRAVIRKGEGS